ncbi:ATP-grasp domain-containing protein [Hahella ganghwensis]|uniref:ATP-grasp domain-containing protein n=1 Tax=Hahella ganghwensis TaxID=286420 RepID=UPI000370A38D|nr:ATP-grasp domain-containing protein [Hahella ganghwensis]
MELTSSATDQSDIPHILVIGGIPSVHSLLHERGASLTLVPVHGHPWPIRRELYQKVVNLESPDQIDQVCETLMAVNQRHPFTGIACLHDYAVIVGAQIAARLRLPWFSEETAKCSVEKWRMRDCLRKQGLDNTDYVMALSRDVVEKFLELKGEGIYKPVDGRASEGVLAINHRTDLQQLHYSDRYMVEAKLSGDEYSVETFSGEGEVLAGSVTQKFKQGFVECGHVTPPLDLPKERQADVVAYVDKALSCLGIYRGIGHTEVFVNSSSIQMVETHLRGGGDRILDLVKLSTSADLTENIVRDILGHPLDLNHSAGRLLSARRAAAVWYLLPEATGEIIAIEGLEQARDIDGVVEVKALKAPGDVTQGLYSSYDRLALAIAIGENPREALLRAQRACRELSVTVSPNN